MNNRKYNGVIKEIDKMIVESFDKHLNNKNAVTIDSEPDGNIIFCVATLDNQDYYDFSLIDLIEKDCYHDNQDWIYRLEGVIEKLKDKN